MDGFKQRIHTIVSDREHGSSTLLQWILDALSGTGNAAPTPVQQRWALRELRRIDRSMVVIHHLLDALGPEPGDHLSDRLREYTRQWAGVPTSVAGQLLSMRDWNQCNLLLHSHSGMLVSAISEVHRAAPGIRFLQTRSVPGSEGFSQYRALREQGVRCDLVEDNQVEAVAPTLDGAWLGVDQFDSAQFVNKAGSGFITRAMLKAGKPVFVLGDSRKQVRHVCYSDELFEGVAFHTGIYLVTERGVYATVSGTNNFS